MRVLNGNELKKVAGAWGYSMGWNGGWGQSDNFGGYGSGWGHNSGWNGGWGQSDNFGGYGSGWGWRR